LQHHLENGPGQQADGQAGDTERPPTQEQRCSDDGGIEDGRSESGQAEALERVEQPGQNAGDVEEEDGGRGDAQELCGLFQQGRVKAAAEQPGGLGGADLHDEDKGRQDQGDEGQEQPHQPSQFAAPFVGGIFAEHGHERRTDHAADEQVVEHGGDNGGHLEGAECAGGAEQVGLHRLADQAEEAAGDIAQGDDGGSAGDAVGFREKRGFRVHA